jgi:hypothetical protein
MEEEIKRGKVDKAQQLQDKIDKEHLQKYGMTADEYYKSIEPKYDNLEKYLQEAEDEDEEYERNRKERLAKIKAQAAQAVKDITPTRVVDYRSMDKNRLWESMSEQGSFIGVPFSSLEFQNDLAGLVGWTHIHNRFQELRTSYNAFCQWQVKKDGPFAAQVLAGKQRAADGTTFKEQRKVAQLIAELAQQEKENVEPEQREMDKELEPSAKRQKIE